MPHRAEIPPAPWKRRFLFLFAFTVLLPAAILLWLAGRFGGDIPVDYADPVEHFKYGSTGGEHEMGFPYWIWRALPEVCGQYLPGPGYQSIGMLYEKKPDGSLRDRHLWKLPPLALHLYALRMDDELDFASASALERAIVEHLAAHPDVRHVCLFAQPINRIDATGVEMFMQLRERLASANVALHISGIKLPVENVLRRAGALNDSPLLHMYRTDVDALQAFGRLSA